MSEEMNFTLVFDADVSKVNEQLDSCADKIGGLGMEFNNQLDEANKSTNGIADEMLGNFKQIAGQAPQLLDEITFAKKEIGRLGLDGGKNFYESMYGRTFDSLLARVHLFQSEMNEILHGEQMSINAWTKSIMPVLDRVEKSKSTITAIKRDLISGMMNREYGYSVNNYGRTVTDTNMQRDAMSIAGKSNVQRIAATEGNNSKDILRQLALATTIANFDVHRTAGFQSASSVLRDYTTKKETLSDAVVGSIIEKSVNESLKNKNATFVPSGWETEHKRSKFLTDNFYGNLRGYVDKFAGNNGTAYNILESLVGKGIMARSNNGDLRIKGQLTGGQFFDMAEQVVWEYFNKIVPGLINKKDIYDLNDIDLQKHLSSKDTSGTSGELIDFAKWLGSAKAEFQKDNSFYGQHDKSYNGGLSETGFVFKDSAKPKKVQYTVDKITFEKDEPYSTPVMMGENEVITMINDARRANKLNEFDEYDNIGVVRKIRLDGLMNDKKDNNKKYQAKKDAYLDPKYASYGFHGFDQDVLQIERNTRDMVKQQWAGFGKKYLGTDYFDPFYFSAVDEQGRLKLPVMSKEEYDAYIGDDKDEYQWQEKNKRYVKDSLTAYKSKFNDALNKQNTPSSLLNKTIKIRKEMYDSLDDETKKIYIKSEVDDDYVKQDLGDFIIFNDDDIKGIYGEGISDGFMVLSPELAETRYRESGAQIRGGKYVKGSASFEDMVQIWKNMGRTEIKDAFDKTWNVEDLIKNNRQVNYVGLSTLKGNYKDVLKGYGTGDEADKKRQEYMTAVWRELPLRAVAAYEYDKPSGSLGNQATQFFAADIGRAIEQSKEYDKILEEINTEAGFFRYVGKNNPQLVTSLGTYDIGSEAVIKAKENFIKQLNDKISRGELISLRGEKFGQSRQTKSAVSMMFEQGFDSTVSEEERNRVIDKAVEWFWNRKNVSEGDLNAWGLLNTDGTINRNVLSDLITGQKDYEGNNIVLDFDNIDSVLSTAIRAPGESGQQVFGRNAAKMLKGYLEAMGEKNFYGVQLNSTSKEIAAGSDEDGDMLKMLSSSLTGDDVIKTLTKLDLLKGTQEERKKALYDSITKGTFKKDFGNALIEYDEAKYGRLVRGAIELLSARTNKLNKENADASRKNGKKTKVKNEEVLKSADPNYKYIEESNATYLGDWEDAEEQSQQDIDARITMGFASVAGMNSSGLKRGKSVTENVYYKQQVANALYDAGTTMQKKKVEIADKFRFDVGSLSKLPTNSGTAQKILKRALNVKYEDGVYKLGSSDNDNEYYAIKEEDVLDLGNGQYAYLPILQGYDYSEDEIKHMNLGERAISGSRLAALTGYTESDADWNRFIHDARNYGKSTASEKDREAYRKLFAATHGKPLSENENFKYRYRVKNVKDDNSIMWNQRTSDKKFNYVWSDWDNAFIFEDEDKNRYKISDEGTIMKSTFVPSGWNKDVGGWSDFEDTGNKGNPFFVTDDKGYIGYYNDKKTNKKIGITADFTMQKYDGDGLPSIGNKRIVVIPAGSIKNNSDIDDPRKTMDYIEERVGGKDIDAELRSHFKKGGAQDVLNNAYDIIAEGYQNKRRLTMSDNDIETLMYALAYYETEVDNVVESMNNSELNKIFTGSNITDRTAQRNAIRNKFKNTREYNALSALAGQLNLGNGYISIGTSTREKIHALNLARDNGDIKTDEDYLQIRQGIVNAALETEHELDPIMDAVDNYMLSLENNDKNKAIKIQNIKERVSKMKSNAYGQLAGSSGSIATHEEITENPFGFLTFSQSDNSLMRGLIKDSMRWAEDTGFLNAIANRKNISQEQYTEAESLFKNRILEMGGNDATATVLSDMLSTGTVGGKKEAELLLKTAIQHGNNYSSSDLSDKQIRYIDEINVRLSKQAELYEDINKLKQEAYKSADEGNETRFNELDKEIDKRESEVKQFAERYGNGGNGNNGGNGGNGGGINNLDANGLADILNAPQRLNGILERLYKHSSDLKKIQGIKTDEDYGFNQYFKSVDSDIIAGKIALDDPQLNSATKEKSAVASAIRVIEQEREAGQQAYIDSLFDKANRTPEEILYGNDFYKFKTKQLTGFRDLNNLKMLPNNILKEKALSMIKQLNLNIPETVDKINKDYDEGNYDELVNDVSNLLNVQGIKNESDPAKLTMAGMEIVRSLKQANDVKNRLTEGTAIANKEKQDKASTEKYINDLLGGVSDFSYKYEKDKKNTNLATLFKKQSGNLKNIQSKRNTINSIIEDMKNNPDDYSNFSEDEKKTLQDNLTKGLANADSMISELVNGTFTEDRMKAYTEAQDKDIEKIKKKFESKKVISAETKNNYIDKYQSKLEELQTIYNTTTDEGAKSMAETQIKKIDKFLEELKTKEAYQDESKVNFARSAMYDANLQAQKHSEWGFQSFRDYGNQYTAKEIQRNIQLLYSKRNERAQELRNQSAYEEGTEQWNASQAKIDAYDAEIEKLNDSLETLGKSLERDGSKLKRFGQDFASASKRFGQDLIKMGIQKATSMLQNYTKQAAKFLVQLETQMADIKSITMKSDEEMVDVRKNVVQQAVELKTSTGNVATVQASLYRQGLSDEDVRKNTAAVVKYAAVTGADVSTAMKNLTTAVQTGLVDNINTAMDVLVALGDTVATTAEQIAKGMQKSAAAAKNADVSYEELTTMLAIGTAKTQLGGTQVGRAMGSIMSRFSRVTKEGYANANDGTISINDVEAALSNVGIATRDSNDSFRNFTEVLVDLSDIWEDLNDVQKANISYAMAGTTQSNIFQSLMSGFAEGTDGKTFGELLEEAKNSAGTTDEKYEIKTDTIEYAVQEFNAALNACTENLFGLTAVVKGIINVATGLIKFFNTSDTSGGILSGGLAIGAIVGKVASPLAGIAVAAAAAGISAIVAGITTAIEHSTKEYKAEQENKSLLAETNAQVKLQQQTDEKITSINSVIETLDEKKSLKEQLSSSEFAYVEELFSAISNKFPEIGNSIDLATVSVEEFRAALNKATEANKEYITDAYLNSMKLVNLDAYKMEDYASPVSGAEWKPIAEGGTSGTGGVSKEDWQQLQDMFNKGGAYITAAKDFFGDDYDMYSEQVTKVANLMYQHGDTYDFTDASNFGYNKKTGGTFEYAPGWSDSFKQFTADFFSPYKTAYETGETSIESKQKTYNDNMYVAETNVAGKIGLYSDYFDSLGLSGITDSLVQKFIDEFGYAIATWDEDTLNSNIRSFINENIISPIANGDTAADILNRTIEGKYADVNGNIYATTDVAANAKIKRESLKGEAATLTSDFKTGLTEMLGDGTVISAHEYKYTNPITDTINAEKESIAAATSLIEGYDADIENTSSEISTAETELAQQQSELDTVSARLTSNIEAKSAKEAEYYSLNDDRDAAQKDVDAAKETLDSAAATLKDYKDNYYDDAKEYLSITEEIGNDKTSYEQTYGISFEDTNRGDIESRLAELETRKAELEANKAELETTKKEAYTGQISNEKYGLAEDVLALRESAVTTAYDALNAFLNDDYDSEMETLTAEAYGYQQEKDNLDGLISEAESKLEGMYASETDWNNLFLTASQGEQQNEAYAALKSVYDFKQNKYLEAEGALTVLNSQIELEFGSDFDVASLESQASDLEETISECERNIETAEAKLDSDEIRDILEPIDKEISSKRERLIQLLQNYYHVELEWDEELGDYTNESIQKAMDSLGLTEEMHPYRTKPAEGDTFTFTAKNYEASSLWYDIIPTLEGNREELYDSMTAGIYEEIARYTSDKTAAELTLENIKESLSRYYEKYGSSKSELEAKLATVESERDAAKTAMEDNGQYNGLSLAEVNAMYEQYNADLSAQEELVASLKAQWEEADAEQKALEDIIDGKESERAAKAAKLKTEYDIAVALRDAKIAEMSGFEKYTGISYDEAIKLYNDNDKELASTEAEIALLKKQLTDYDTIGQKIVVQNGLSTKLGGYAGLEPDIVVDILEKKVEEAQGVYDAAVAVVDGIQEQIDAIVTEISDLTTNIIIDENKASVLKDGIGSNNVKINTLKYTLDELEALKLEAQNAVAAAEGNISEAEGTLSYYQTYNGELDTLTTELLDMLNGNAELTIANLEDWINKVKDSGLDYNTGIIDYVENYITKMRAIAAEAGLSDDELIGAGEKLYDITTGKRIGKTAQDYISTSTGVFNFTEQQNKKDFINFLKQYDSLQELYNGFVDNQDKLTSFSGYISTEEFAEAAAAVQANTSSYEQLIDTMIEAVESISEASIYSADYINGVSKNLQNKILFDAIASGNYTAQQEQEFYSVTGITEKLSRSELMAAGNSYSKTATDSVTNTLKENGIALIQDIIGAAKGLGFDYTKWDTTTTVDTMLSDLTNYATANGKEFDASSYSNIYNRLYNQGLRMTGLTQMSNPLVYTSTTEGYEGQLKYVGYDEGKTKYYETADGEHEAGGFYVTQQVTDSAGNGIYVDSEGNEYRGVDFDNGTAKGYILNEKKYITSVQQEGEDKNESNYFLDENGIKITLTKNEDGNYIGQYENGETNGKTYYVQTNSEGKISYAVDKDEIVTEDTKTELFNSIDRKWEEKYIGNAMLSNFTAADINTNFDGDYGKYINALVASAADYNSYNIRAQESFTNMFSSGKSYDEIVAASAENPELYSYLQSNTELQNILYQLSEGAITAAEAFNLFNESLGNTAQAAASFKSSVRSLTTDFNKTQWYLDNKDNLDLDGKNYLAQLLGFSDYETALKNGYTLDKIIIDVEEIHLANKEKIIDNINSQIENVFRDNEGNVLTLEDVKTTLGDNAKLEYANGENITLAANTTKEMLLEMYPGMSEEEAETFAAQSSMGNELVITRKIVYKIEIDEEGNEISRTAIGSKYEATDVNGNAINTEDYKTLYSKAQQLSSNNISYNDAAKWMQQLSSGTITESNLNNLASYLETSTSKIRNDTSFANSLFGVKTQEHNEENANTLTKAYNVLAKEAKAAGIEIKDFGVAEGDAAGLAQAIRDNVSEISPELENTLSATEAIVDSLDDATTNAENLKSAISSAMDEIDMTKAQQSLNDYLTSGSASMDDFNEKLKANDAWTSIITNSSEAVRIMAAYEAGIINANEAMKQLAATTSLIPVSREADVKDNREKDYKTLTSFDGLDEGTYTSANKMNSIRDFLQGKYYGAVDPRTGKRTGGLYYTDASLFEEAMQDNPYLETLMTEGISEDKWYEAYYGALGLYSTNEYLNTLGAGALSKFTGYGDTIGSMSAALYSGDWQKWQTDVSSIATEQGQAQAYYDIMMKARRVGGAEYLDNADEVNLLKQAQEYYGFDYNDKDAESKMNEILSGFSGILNIIANLFGKDSELYKELSDYWNGKSQYAKDVANGTEASAESYTSATVNKTRQDKYDLWYDAWSKAEDKSKVNPLDYGLSGTDEAVNIYNGYNAATTGAEKNRYVTNAYNGTTLSSIRNIGSTVTEESAKAFADLVIAGKTEDAYTYLNNGNLGADTKASEIYGDSLNKLLTGNYAPEDYEYLLSDAERTGQNYFINQAKEKGTISSAAADLALQMVSYSGANQDDIDKFKNDILYSKKSEVLSANDTIYNAEKNLEKLKTFTTEEGAQSFMERNGYSWDKNLTFDENKERFIASMNSAISSGNETRKDWVAAWRFATPEQRALYGMPVTEEEFYNTYKFNPNDYTINQEQYQNEDEYTSPYKYSDEAYRGRLAYDVLNSDTKEEFLTKVQSDADYEEYIKQNAELNDIYQELQKSAGSWTKAQEKLKKELGYDATSIANVTKEAVGLTAQYQEVLGMANKKTYNRKKGSDDMNFFQSLLGIDFEDLQKYSDAELNNFAQQFADSYLQQMNEQASNAADSFAVEDILGEDGTHTYQLGDMEIVPGQVIDVGIEQAIAEAHARGDADTEAILNAWKQAGAKSVTRTTVITTNGNTSTATFQYSATSKSGIGGSSKSSSGGGGSSKSAVQKAITAADRLVKAQQHRVDLLDAKADVYKEKGELTNYGKLLTYKNTEQIELQNKYREGINKIRQAMGSAKKDSDDYWSAYEKINEYEEAIEKLNSEIEANNKLIEENNEDIRQTKITVQETIRDAIEAELELNNAILDAQVSLEDEILEAIKARYQNEWNLIEEDLNRKKEAIEKEKSLLEERVSARRETEDRITQEEEKAELERQLAMVEMDSTRTKDAAALREQIANLDKELNRAAEDDLIASQQAMMDDEIAAIDDMLESGSQELETFLADANNFSTELNSILELGQDDLLSWLKENVVAFKESTDAAQQQMINSWKDTYEQFKNITENYQERINEIMSSKDKFLAAMEQTDEYQKADEVTRESMRYEWSTMYDDMINAQIDSNYEWSHTDGNEKTDTTAEINETSLKIYNSTYEIENYTAKIAKILEELSKNSVTQYATGGLVDYTGYAWVDGSPSKPEYVLSANQWADFSEMIDSSKFSYIPDRINYSGTGFDASSISMVNNITINQASISDSMDIAELAQQVGEEFSKSLSLNGFNTRFNI